MRPVNSQEPMIPWSVDHLSHERFRALGLGFHFHKECDRKQMAWDPLT